MPTYASRRSSSISAGSPKVRMWGKIPSSIPARKTAGILETLGVVEGHQRDGSCPLLKIVASLWRETVSRKQLQPCRGSEGRPTPDPVDHRSLVETLKLARHRRQLTEVLDAAQRFDTLLGFEHREVPGVVHDCVNRCLTLHRCRPSSSSCQGGRRTRESDAAPYAVSCEISPARLNASPKPMRLVLRKAVEMADARVADCRVWVR